MIRNLIQAFGKTLAQTEWLSPEKLRIYQEPLILKLLLHARQSTDFYCNRFGFELDSAEDIESNWSAIPILTRTEAVANREQLLSRFVPPEAGATQQGTTSGSTGVPLAFSRSEITAVASQALNERMMRWWQVDGSRPSARIAFDRSRVAAPPDGAKQFGWHSAHPHSPYYVLSTAADIETQKRWLAERRPAYLGSYASILKELALACRRSDTRLKFDLLFSFGTVVDEETRDLCRSVFGAEIADTYGAEEAGHFAAQCPQCGEYHISAEAMIVEVLRADGSAAAAGEIGRVVVTSLYNYAMPLIRYEIGDLAEMGSERSRCRRGLPSLRRIHGRYRNLFRFRDGKIGTISAGQFRLREFLALSQVQIVQLDVDRIEIRWVSDGSPIRPLDLPALTERVRMVVRRPVEVSVRQVEVIERSPSGKFEDCISLVPRE